MRVRLSQDASNFLRKETQYLKQFSPAAARRLLTDLDQVRANLARFPRMGLRSEDAVTGSRHFVVGDYVLSYDLEEGGIAITAIRHGKMQPGSAVVDDDVDYESDE